MKRTPETPRAEPKCHAADSVLSRARGALGSIRQLRASPGRRWLRASRARVTAGLAARHFGLARDISGPRFILYIYGILRGINLFGSGAERPLPALRAA